MSVRGAIARLATGSYPLVRQVASTYDANGYLVDDGAETPSEITASIQPLSGDELQQLAEGQTATGKRVVYSLDELRTRTPSNDPDVLTYDNASWEVVSVERWDHRGESYWKAIIARVEA